mgnify:CR=1 FL=1
MATGWFSGKTLNDNWDEIGRTKKVYGKGGNRFIWCENPNIWCENVMNLVIRDDELSRLGRISLNCNFMS